MQEHVQDLEAYARYLGLDPVADAELMWIAKEGLSAPLPDAWAEFVDETGHIYCARGDGERARPRVREGATLTGRR